MTLISYVSLVGRWRADGKGWEDGLPWLLLAAQQVVQESTRFSPNDLVFSPTVHDPVAALKECWATEQLPQNVFDYVPVWKFFSR